jgi:predicted transcriptional regulator
MELILSGEKTVEYRRRTPTKPVSLIVLYASSPVKRIVGFIEVLGIVCGSRAEIWRTTSNAGGISKVDFDSYFEGADRCCHFQLGKLIKVNPIAPSKVRRGFQIPQSYRYVDARFVQKIYDHSTSA